MSLPYITNTSVIDERPHYVSGSQNVLTAIDAVARQRPGFIYAPAAINQFTANPSIIKRYFFWQQSSTEQFILISVVGASTGTRVYKVKVGTDTTWQLIYTGSGGNEPFDYVVSHGFVYFSNGTDQKKYDGMTVNNWGTTTPGAIISATNTGAGNVPNHIGHSYCFAYGVAATGYLSDISPLKAIAPAGGESRTWDIVGPRSTDTQIDKVHIFRTEDGGATLLELSNSPIANPAGNWTISDNDLDTSLQAASPAPLRYVNSPPPAMFQPTIFAGRIWAYNTDTVYFSTLEENNTSVPEECFGTTLTNSYRFGRTVNGLAVAGDFLLVFSNRGIFKIGGDTLVTFYRATLSKSHGLHFRHNVADYKDGAVWLDTSNTLLVTDGISVGEPDISLPIRPDIATINHSQSMVAVHRDGKRSWIILMSGTDGITAGATSTLYLFDADRKQWLPPWALTELTAIASNAVFDTGITLYVARFGRSMAMDETATADANSSDSSTSGFAGELRLSLFPINKDNPTGIGDVEYVAVERNDQALSDVLMLMDEKPSTGTYTSLMANEENPDQRVPGTDLVEKWYWNRTDVSPGQRVSVKLRWGSGEVWAEPWELYCLDVVYKKVK